MAGLIKSFGNTAPQAGLAVVGRFKAGMISDRRLEKRGKPGQYWHPPQKLDHWRVTLNERGQCCERNCQPGNFMVDAAAEAACREYDPQMRRLPIRFHSNRLTDVYNDWFAATGKNEDGRTIMVCNGDGQTATWLRSPDRIPPTMPIIERTPAGPRVKCAGLDCPVYAGLIRGLRCKINLRLRAILEVSQTLGGIYLFSSSSYNSAQQLRGSLAVILGATRGQLAGIRLELALGPKPIIRPDGAPDKVWCAWIQYRGGVLALLNEAKQFRTEMLEAGDGLKQIPAMVADIPWDAEDPVEAIEAEFYDGDSEPAEAPPVPVPTVQPAPPTTVGDVQRGVAEVAAMPPQTAPSPPAMQQGYRCEGCGQVFPADSSSGKLLAGVSKLCDDCIEEANTKVLRSRPEFDHCQECGNGQAALDDNGHCDRCAELIALRSKVAATGQTVVSHGQPVQPPAPAPAPPQPTVTETYPVGLPHTAAIPGPAPGVPPAQPAPTRHPAAAPPPPPAMPPHTQSSFLDPVPSAPAVHPMTGEPLSATPPAQPQPQPPAQPPAPVPAPTPAPPTVPPPPPQAPPAPPAPPVPPANLDGMPDPTEMIDKMLRIAGRGVKRTARLIAAGRAVGMQLDEISSTHRETLMTAGPANLVIMLKVVGNAFLGDNPNSNLCAYVREVLGALPNVPAPAAPPPPAQPVDPAPAPPPPVTAAYVAPDEGNYGIRKIWSAAGGREEGNATHVIAGMIDLGIKGDDSVETMESLDALIGQLDKPRVRELYRTVRDKARGNA